MKPVQLFTQQVEALYVYEHRYTSNQQCQPHEINPPPFNWVSHFAPEVCNHHQTPPRTNQPVDEDISPGIGYREEIRYQIRRNNRI